MFSSSVTVRVQLSGAAVAEPHSVLVVLVAGPWWLWLLLGLRELCRQEQLYEQGKKSNTESWKLLCVPRKVRLGTAAWAKLSRADYTLPKGLSYNFNIGLLEQYCSVTKCIQVL